jgi:hypothetical protein
MSSWNDPDSVYNADETYLVIGMGTATNGDFADIDIETVDGSNVLTLNGIDTTSFSHLLCWQQHRRHPYRSHLF